MGSIDVDVTLEFFNTFFIKDTNIYFGHKDKVYVISKQLIVYVFGVCAEGFVEEPKGQVNKSLAVQALQNCRLARANSFCRLMECKEFRSAILCQISYHYICHLSEGEGTIF